MFLMELHCSNENLSKYQDILSLVTTFSILIIGMFEQVLIMQREISFSSLLGLKGFKIGAGGGEAGFQIPGPRDEIDVQINSNLRQALHKKSIA